MPVTDCYTDVSTVCVNRVNGAVTQGYEEDVGNRTSVYVHTAFSLYANILSLKKYGFNSIPQDEVSIFYTGLTVCM